MSPGSVLPPVGCRVPTGFAGQDAATRRRCRSPPHTVRGGSDIGPSRGLLSPRAVESHVNHHRCGQTTRPRTHLRRHAERKSGFAAVSGCRASVSRVRILPARTVPMRDGHIHLHAQRHPDIPGRDPARQRLLRGATADPGQTQVAHQRCGARTELPFDGAIELAAAHRVSAGTARSRPRPPGRRGRRRERSAGPR